MLTAWQTSEADNALAADFCEKLPELLQKGVIKPNTVKMYEGGLDDIPKGFQEYRDGVISNYKIVYKV